MTEYVVATSELHPRDRFEYWHAMTCRAFIPYECKPIDRASFAGELRSMPFAGLSLLTNSCSGLTTWRTPRQAATQSKETVYVYLQLDGQVTITQHGRETAVRNGDIVLVDTIGTSSFTHSTDSKSMTLELSRRDCEARLGRIEQWTARRIDGSQGAGALASNFVRLLPDQAASLSQAAQHHVAAQATDLVALALTEGVGHKLVHSSGRLVSLLRLKAAVEAGLSDGNVTCDDLAAAAGISVRYANQLLDAEQTSLQRLLFSRRIAKCQAALADPAQAHRQISDIAYSWGFGDVSHFGRLFKAMVGLTPRDFRKLSLQAAVSR